MYKDKVGFPVFNSQDIFELIYKGKSDVISDLLVENSNEIRLFNSFSETQLNIYNLNISEDTDIAEIDKQLQSFWFMPAEYHNINIEEYLLARCKTPEQQARVNDELAEFDRRGFIILLKFLIYLVDFMRENNIVWGVGRGSSVASYILYLIGIHRVDSIKYDLDFYEFMR